MGWSSLISGGDIDILFLQLDVADWSGKGTFVCGRIGDIHNVEGAWVWIGNYLFHV